MQQIERRRCFDGWLEVYQHDSVSCKTPMTFAIYLPPQVSSGKLPALYWLSGLTCTHENFIIKAGAQRYAAEHGIVLVVPDTSPRNTGIPGEKGEEHLGEGAGFYVNATQAPWNKHYQMFDYVTAELPALVENHFPVAADKRSISGHSMGGHGALIAFLRQPDRYASVSAFAPVCRPTQSPWGRKALSTYLGSDENTWLAYDATHLLGQTKQRRPILIDQGAADPALKERLRLHDLVEVAEACKYPLQVHMREGYDHSYYYVSSFIGEHIAYHARALGL